MNSKMIACVIFIINLISCNTKSDLIIPDIGSSINPVDIIETNEIVLTMHARMDRICQNKEYSKNIYFSFDEDYIVKYIEVRDSSYMSIEGARSGLSVEDSIKIGGKLIYEEGVAIYLIFPSGWMGYVDSAENYMPLADVKKCTIQ